MRVIRFSVSVAIFAVAGLSSSAQAGVVYNAASRSVVAAYQFPTFGDMDSASFNELGLWTGVGHSFSSMGTVFATVGQASLLHPMLISFTTSVSATAHPFENVSSIFAAAESHMNVSFTLTDAMPFEFSASWTTTGIGAWPVAALPYVALYYGPDQDEILLMPVLVSTSGEALQNSIFISGTLQPGEYVLDTAMFLHAASGNEWGNAVSSFNGFLQFDLLFIPAPHAIAVFGGAALLRRRRRR